MGQWQRVSNHYEASCESKETKLFVENKDNETIRITREWCYLHLRDNSGEINTITHYKDNGEWQWSIQNKYGVEKKGTSLILLLV